MSDYFEKVSQTRDKLNAVGKGFCLMKWMTQTLYLHMGDNHSCYHPRPHKIQLSDIENNPSGLHNTAQKKQQRKIMLEGGRPDECYYCWNIEDLEGAHLSDRMIHSTSEYALPELEKISKLKGDENINPRHIEVSFGNACNFKCGYCCPQASSSWMNEIKTYGNYDITTNQYSIDFLKNSDFFHPEDQNPYVDAFWKWWPELKKDLKVFRITGGEPLINANTMKLLDMLDEEPAPHLQLHCNSNLGMAPAIVERFSAKVAKLVREKKIKDFRLFTSIDSWGPRAEYMRNGLDCHIWETNMRTYLNSVPGSRINFMCTFNVLCVTSFDLLLKKILEWRQEFQANDPHGHNQRFNFDTPYLKEPPHWMINILPNEFNGFMDSHLKFMKDHLRSLEMPHGFDSLEIEKFKRVADYMLTNPVKPESIQQGRRDFYTFFNEHDRRRKTNFAETFPDYSEFMSLCKTTYENY